MKLSHVTFNDVILAIHECDRIGVHRFLEEHGYKSSVRWRLHYRGKNYPSKAILGRAAGLEAREFFGGIAQTVPTLRKLGFDVREGAIPNPTPLVHQIILGMLRETGRTPLPVDPAAYFRSGSNRPGDIRGMSAAGSDIGVVATEILSSKDSLAELEALSDSGLQVFVDSGAFSEVDRDLNIKNPISLASWERILDLYERLARQFGSNLWVVAPDCVGRRDITLARLSRYAGRLRQIHRLGARVLVAMQGTDSDFYLRASRILGFGFVPALPCKKNATKLGQVQPFLEMVNELALPDTPRHVHFLGMGPTNPLAADFAEVAERWEFSYSFDSNWIRANVGRRERRRLTVARDRATLLLGALATSALVQELGLLLCLGVSS